MGLNCYIWNKNPGNAGLWYVSNGWSCFKCSTEEPEFMMGCELCLLDVTTHQVFSKQFWFSGDQLRMCGKMHHTAWFFYFIFLWFTEAPNLSKTQLHAFTLFSLIIPFCLSCLAFIQNLYICRMKQCISQKLTTKISLESSFNPTCMFLECGRNLQKTQKLWENMQTPYRKNWDKTGT